MRHAAEVGGPAHTNLGVFEDLVFLRSLLKEDFVLAVSGPGQQRLHQVLVVLEGPFWEGEPEYDGLTHRPLCCPNWSIMGGQGAPSKRREFRAGKCDPSTFR